MQIRSFTCNPFQTNCYVCHDEGEAVLVDPSCSTDEEKAAVERFVSENGLTMRHLLLTHAHIDHIFGCRHFADLYGMGFQMHRADRPMLLAAEEQARLFGVDVEQPPEPQGFLDEDDTVTFGGVTLRVLHTPGHSPGSISFFDEPARSVLAGDVLFQRSIGRTDLWQGSLPQLMESIFRKLIPLGDDVDVHPGHGPATTIGEERRSNPFLTGQEPAS
jgi:glyoxylase-like metal-dependent hydrolase (beta-lactamase superfamily II)